MSAYMEAQLKRAEEIKAQRAATQATESVEEAQAALEHALDKYSALPCSRNAYDVTAAWERVEAAKARESKPLQSLAEWAQTPGGQEFIDQDVDADLGAELSERNAARVARRHPDQPHYQAWRLVPSG